MSSASIALFDSGCGGLSVLRAIAQRLPQENCLYFADSANLPYGGRSRTEIRQFAERTSYWLKQHPLKAIVVACNTSNALALDIIENTTALPVINLIECAATAVRKQRIAVLCTEATAQSHYYRQRIQHFHPQAEIDMIACPAFVPLIEQRQHHTPLLRQHAQMYFKRLHDNPPDTVILGCSHYVWCADTLASCLPSSCQLLDPAEPTAAAIETHLHQTQQLNNTTTASHQFFCTGDTQTFADSAAYWLNQTGLTAQSVNLTEQTI